MNERQDPTNGTLPCFNSDVRLLSAYRSGFTVERLPAPILCLHKPFVAFLEKKRFLSAHNHGVPDSSAADLCGSGTAFVFELLNDEDSSVFPTNCPGKEISVFIHIQIDSNIRFPTL